MDWHCWRVMERMWLPTKKLIQALRGFAPLPDLECALCPQFSQKEMLPRLHPWESTVLLRLSGPDRWLNPVKSSLRGLRILAGVYEDLLLLGPPRQASYKFLWSLNLPPTNAAWVSSPFNLLCPLCIGSQFWISSGEFLSLQTNRNLNLLMPRLVLFL